MFTEKEITYIQSQPLARLATVSASLQPDVAPVGFQFDGEKFFITGFDITRTFKYKNVKAGNQLVALVIDDLASVQPWQARGIKIHGKAEIAEINRRASLGIIHSQLDDTTYAYAYNTGRSMTMEQVIELALSQTKGNETTALPIFAKHD